MSVVLNRSVTLTRDNVVAVFRATLNAAEQVEFDACDDATRMTIACEELAFDPDAKPVDGEPYAVPSLSLKSFSDAVRHAVRNPALSVSIGGASFNRDEMRDLLTVLDDYTLLAHDFAVMKSTNAANATARANLAAELREAHAKANSIPDRLWPAIVRPGMYAGPQGDKESRRTYMERALAAYSDAQADMDAKSATLAPVAPSLVANTTRACYWRTKDGFRWSSHDTTADEIATMSGGYPKLDALMRLKGEDQRTIDGVLRNIVLDAHKLGTGQ